MCYQAAIAAGQVIGATRTVLRLLDRSLTVELAEDLAWVVTPADGVDRGPEIEAPGGLPARVVDTGRRRAYAVVDDNVLLDFRLAPDEALAWLRSAELSGLCLVHEAARDSLRLRVFTTSLDGREDVATGGAAAGLPAALGRAGTWSVHQGLGPAHRRGLLNLRAEPTRILVGGSWSPLVSGQLLAPWRTAISPSGAAL